MKLWPVSGSSRLVRIWMAMFPIWSFRRARASVGKITGRAEMKWAIVCAIPLVALAACGGAEENKAKGKADTMQPGQYEVTAEVTNFRAADKGTPKINTKQGDSTTRSVCLTEGASP